MLGIVLIVTGSFLIGHTWGKYSAARIFVRALREASKQGQTVREFLDDLESDESEAA